MIRLTLRLRIAWWSLLNAERLLALYFEMLRDNLTYQKRHIEMMRYGGKVHNYNSGRANAAIFYAQWLNDMPKAYENKAAL